MIPEKITVEVWGDFTCVHCYLAMKNFETALSKFKHRNRVEVVFRSFELAPGLVVERGKSMYEFLADFNNATIEQVKEVCSQISTVGNKTGVSFNFETAIPANSFLAHQFIHLAKEYNMQSEAKEVLFQAHFSRGWDIDDIAVLKKIATLLGMNPGALDNLTTQDKYADAVKRDEEDARKLGIKAVPHYLINSNHSITGAKDSAAFLDLLEESFLDAQKRINSPNRDACEIGKAC